jgi:plasmid maintenance system antidote protein VapI
MLHLTSNEFTQFREGELDISDILIDRLHQFTGFSKQLWLNRLAKHKERYQK